MASRWHHPRTYPVWVEDDPVKSILDEIVNAKYRRERKIVYLETGTGLAAVYECNVDYTPRAIRRLRRGNCYLYRCRPAVERRDVMRYAVLLAEDHGKMRLEAAGPRGIIEELHRELAAVRRERRAHVQAGLHDIPEVVRP